MAMTTPAAQPLLPTGLLIDPAETARMLRTSRARLAELTLAGELTRYEGGYARDEVERIVAERTPPGGWTSVGFTPPEGRLGRMLDRVVWLLHDWGGAATMLDLQVALLSNRPAVEDLVHRLRDIGYVEKRGRQWHLADIAWEYTRRHDPPI